MSSWNMTDAGEFSVSYSLEKEGEKDDLSSLKEQNYELAKTLDEYKKLVSEYESKILELETKILSQKLKILDLKDSNSSKASLSVDVKTKKVISNAITKMSSLARDLQKIIETGENQTCENKSNDQENFLTSIDKDPLNVSNKTPKVVPNRSQMSVNFSSSTENNSNTNKTESNENDGRNRISFRPRKHGTFQEPKLSGKLRRGDPFTDMSYLSPSDIYKKPKSKRSIKKA